MYSRKSPSSNRDKQRVCQHCHKTGACRPYQLCWKCYYMEGVRDLYKVHTKWNRRGAGQDGKNRPFQLPDSPTSYLPGTEEKIAVLEERASQGISLHHPCDAGCEGLFQQRTDIIIDGRGPDLQRRNKRRV